MRLALVLAVLVVPECGGGFWLYRTPASEEELRRRLLSPSTMWVSPVFVDTELSGD